MPTVDSPFTCRRRTSRSKGGGAFKQVIKRLLGMPTTTYERNVGQFGGACIGLRKAFVRPLDKEWSRAGHLRAKPPYRILGSKPHEKFSVRSSTGRYRKCLSPHLSASKKALTAMIRLERYHQGECMRDLPKGFQKHDFPFYSWAQGHEPNV